MDIIDLGKLLLQLLKPTLTIEQFLEANSRGNSILGMGPASLLILLCRMISLDESRRPDAEEVQKALDEILAEVVEAAFWNNW